MKHALLLTLSVTLMLLSCGNGPAGQKENTQDTTAQTPASAIVPHYDTTLPKGKIIDSVICSVDPSQSYALYLPAHYSKDHPSPCIYFFDAHARGALPLRLYKDLAEQYGFILIGSDMSKNGTPWPVTEAGARAMLIDSRTRLNIDTMQIYTAGFSGGSRIASKVAEQYGFITGIIACAAGFPGQALQVGPQVRYFGIVGKYDFNTVEMEQQDAQLQQQGLPHAMLETDGKHDWATAKDFKTALLWMQVSSKHKLLPEDDQRIAALEADYKQRIANAAADPVAVYGLLTGLIGALGSSGKAVDYTAQAGKLTTGAAYKSAVEQHSRQAAQEQDMQQQLGREFTQQDVPWWQAKISELKQNARKAKVKQEELMYLRLINYLGLVGYLTADHALKSGDLEHAAVFLKIFKMADPENPDCDYLSAICYAKKGDGKNMLSALNAAAALGYSEVPTLLSEPSFVPVIQSADFKKLLERVRGNYKSR